MLKKEEILLLKILLLNISFSPLREKGYTYSQITMILRKLIVDGYIETIDDVAHVTEKGRLIIKKYDEEKHLSGSGKWILPQEKYYETPLGKDQIILPKKI